MPKQPKGAEMKKHRIRHSILVLATCLALFLQIDTSRAQSAADSSFDDPIDWQSDSVVRVVGLIDEEPAADGATPIAPTSQPQLGLPETNETELPPPTPATADPRENIRKLLTTPLEKVEFTDVPIRTAMDLFADQTNLNVVLSPRIPNDPIALKLKNVTPITALEIITRSQGLWYRINREEAVVFVFTNEERGSLPPDPAALSQQINEAFPDSYVKISIVGEKIVVRGEAKDVLEAENIIRIVSESALPSKQEEPPVNLDVSVSQTNYGLRNGTLEGLNNSISEQVRQNLDRRNNRVINLLRIPGTQQVMLKVTVAEVNRTAARNIGLNFNIANSGGMSVFQNITGPINNQLAQAVTSTTGADNLPVVLDNGQVKLAIEALRRMNLARSLAEPNLTAINGEKAEFRAGGQFPVPVVSGGVTDNGLQGVQFIPFGVSLKFTPHILERDRVRLTLAAEVSVREPEIGADVGGNADAGGTSVPGLNTRTFSTTVELGGSQTLAVAGLIQTNYGAVSDRVPFWGDLPLIGRTGAHDRVTAGEQELVILVTPEFVEPVGVCETPPLPGSDVFEPGDVAFYLGGQLESRRSRDYRSTVRTDYQRQKKYEHCETELIIGPTGYSNSCVGKPVSTAAAR